MPRSAAALLAGPDRLLAWADRRSMAIYHGGLAAIVGTILLWQAHAIAGTAGLAVLGTALTSIGATVLGYRRAPQLTGTLASTFIMTSLVMMLAAAMDPLWMLVGVDELALIYPALFLVVAMCAWLMPSTGVHRGWTTVVGQFTLAASLPLAVWATGTSWRGVAVLGGAAAALLVVGLRIRKVAPADRATGWRRAARGAALSMVAIVLAGSAAIAGSGQARAFSMNPADWAGAIKDTVVCSVTGPNLSNEPVGTGPESLISNINFGGAHQPGLPADQQPPRYADVATNFTRAADAENYSLSSYTLYEVAGLRGLKWVNWQKDQDGEEACGFGPWTSVMIGNLLFKVTTYGLQTTLAFKEWSQVENPLGMLYTQANPMIADLFTKFLLPMGGIMFMIAGLAIVATATRSTGFREGIGNAGISLVVLALAGFAYGGLAAASFTNPNGNGFYMVAGFMDKVAAGMNNAFAEMAFSTINTENSSMCHRPGSHGSDVSPVAPGQRLTSCILAESLAYKPWAIGQFGVAGAQPIPAATEPTRFSNPSTDAEPAMEQGSGDALEAGLPCYNNMPDHNGVGCGDLRTYLIAQEGGPSIAARISACISSDGADTGDEPDYEVLARCEPYHAVAANLYQQAETGGGMPTSMAADIVGAYQGQGTFPHVSQAFASIIGVIVTGVGLGGMGVITLGWHAWLWALFMMGLFQLVWGAYPGKSKVAVQWGTNVMSTFAQRALYGFAMTLMIWVIAVVFAMQINTGLKILWTILVLVATWMLIQKIQNAASDGSPNVARYGKLAGAAPAALGGYAGAKASMAGARFAAPRVVDGTVKVGRGVRGAGVGTAKAAGKGAGWVGGKAVAGGRKVAQPIGDNMSLKTEAAAARVKDKNGTVGDKARVKLSGAKAGVQETGAVLGYGARRIGHGASFVGSKVRDSSNQTLREQMRGTQGGHRAAFDAGKTGRDLEKASEKERRSNRHQQRESSRAERAQRARERDAKRAEKRGNSGFGPSAPVNRSSDT